MQKIFTKPTLSITQQIELLESRGLNVPRKDIAAHYLSFIGFYRLSGYTRFFMEASTDRFRNNITFNHVLDLYTFDRELKLLFLDATERIEVAARTVISNTLSEKYGSHWYTDSRKFRNDFHYQEFIIEIEQLTGLKKNKGKQSPIFKNYYEKYNEPKYPPSWMLAEGLTFGAWSRIYEYLSYNEDKHKIAKSFGMHYKVMQSWLQSITCIRNICAHHERLWNRKFTIAPCVPFNMPDIIRKQFFPNHLLYPQVVMLHLLLSVISKNDDWKKRLSLLFKKHPWIPIRNMGFPENWDNASFWKWESKPKHIHDLMPA